MPNVLTITIDDAGGVSVTGPINNPLFAYGMLEAGRQAIQEHVAAQQRRVQLAGPGALPPAGKMS